MLEPVLSEEVAQRYRVCGSSISDWETYGSCQLCSICFDHVDSSSAERHRLAETSAADWFNKNYAMCYHVYVIMPVTNS